MTSGCEIIILPSWRPYRFCIKNLFLSLKMQEYRAHNFLKNKYRQQNIKTSILPIRSKSLTVRFGSYELRNQLSKAHE